MKKVFWAIVVLILMSSFVLISCSPQKISYVSVGETNSTTATLDNNQKEIDTLKQQVLSLQSTLDEKQKEISKMKDTIKNLQNTLSEATTTVVETTAKETTSTTKTVETTSKETVAATTQASETAAATTQAQTSGYFEVFSFSGNGIKSSESFTINGSKFKIAYSCSGDLSQAFLYKENGDLENLIVNTVGSANDETIFHGSGTYYIEANMIGDFSMVVYDYR